MRSVRVQEYQTHFLSLNFLLKRNSGDFEKFLRNPDGEQGVNVDTVTKKRASSSG